MSTVSKSLKVPALMASKYEEITYLTDKFSKEKLNDEYAELARRLIATLCRKKPSPLSTGTAVVWACSTIHALGRINFLHDKGTKPYVSNSDLVGWFGLSRSTVADKSKQICEMLKIRHFDHTWMLASKHKESSAVWLLSVNGVFVDIRNMPVAVQAMAFKKGLIPYIPAFKDD